MEDPKTLDLVKELVLRLITPPSASPDLTHPPPDFPKALRYAHRLLSSRMSPSAAADEFAISESIKRQLVTSGRSADALSFADLLSGLASRSGAGSIQNRFAVLYLLKNISNQNPRVSLSPSLTLPLLNLDQTSVRPSRKSHPGIIFPSRDPENLREIALREYADLAREDTPALVKDLLYVIQGIDGTLIRYNSSIDAYDLKDPLSVSPSTRITIRKLAELGWLYRKVNNFVLDCTERISAADLGTIGQALCSAIKEELSEYYKLLAVLESHSKNKIPNGNYLSLRRLVVWLAEPTLRMRLMAVLVDSCKSLRGGAMAGAIHEFAQHGDPLVQEFMRRLLLRVCSPLFEMVRSWVLEGELDDLYKEFFIIGEEVKAESLWREGYKIESSMLPSFISPDLANRILRTGKSINFLRACCDDKGWATAAAEAAAHVGTTTRRGSLGYGETDALQNLVIEAAKRIDRHLMEVIHGRYRFRVHCMAIKRYLLLGQGDFVQYLMDVVGPELSEAANTISAFQLSGLLESAIRGSNAQYDDQDILDRLKVKMMEHKLGDQGWDVFSLEYDARVPLDTIFSASVMKRYLRVFNFLLKLRRVEHALIAVWKTMKPNRIQRHLKEKVELLRKCQVLRNEMNHFVTNLQYYIMFEVLEVSWAQFSEEMEGAKDLDDLLSAHEKYLGAILEKSLMGEKSEGINGTLFALLDIILKFRSCADRWFEGVFEPQPRGKVGERMGKELDAIAREYSSSLKTFISQLPLQQHVDLKFLLFRLDFTEYYSRFSSLTFGS